MASLDDCERLDLYAVFRVAAGYPDGNQFWLETKRGRTLLAVDHRAATLRLGPQAFELSRTSQHFGGCRTWAKCTGCGRRAGVLYRAPWSGIYNCRICTRLPYATAAADSVGRARLRVVRLRRDLARASVRGARPQRARAERLRAKVHAAERRYDVVMSDRVRLLMQGSRVL